MMQIFRNSGKDYNDFGRFKECQESEEFNYILAYLSPPTQFTNPLAVGLCVPQACKVEDLNAFKQYIIPAVNSIIPFTFEGVHDLGLSDLYLNPENGTDITFELSQQMNDQATKFGFSNIFFVALLSGLVIFTIVSTFKSNKKIK